MQETDTLKYFIFISKCTIKTRFAAGLRPDPLPTLLSPREGTGERGRGEERGIPFSSPLIRRERG